MTKPIPLIVLDLGGDPCAVPAALVYGMAIAEDRPAEAARTIELALQAAEAFGIRDGAAAKAIPGSGPAHLAESRVILAQLRRKLARGALGS